MTIKAQGSKEIGALITRAVKAVNVAMPLVHAAAVQCLAHAAEHHDTTLMQRLVEGIAKDGNKNFVRVEALKKWVDNYSPIGFNGDNKTHERKDQADRTRLLKPYDVDGANKVPFWEFSQEPGFTAWTEEDLFKAYHSIKRKFERMVDEGRFKGDVPKAQAVIKRVEAAVPDVSADAPAAAPTAAVTGLSKSPDAKAKKQDVLAKARAAKTAKAKPNPEGVAEPTSKVANAGAH